MASCEYKLPWLLDVARFVGRKTRVSVFRVVLAESLQLPRLFANTRPPHPKTTEGTRELLWWLSSPSSLHVPDGEYSSCVVVPRSGEEPPQR